MKKVVTIGGGTGTFTVLTGLKKYPLELSAIVTMSDDGGSSGVLRDEFGVLPPGDLRQCLVALSDADMVMRKLFNHRYATSDLAGHNFGNLFISTLEQVTGNLDKALDLCGEILKIRGRVIPVTLSKVRLIAELKNGKVLQGETELGDYQLVSKFGIQKMQLQPKSEPNPKALKVIREADIIVVGPGDLYTSLIPNFLVTGIGKAFAQSKATKVLVVNLMNKHGHTDDFTVLDYVRTLESFIGPTSPRPSLKATEGAAKLRRAGKKNVFDVIVYNTKKPARALVRKYADEGEPVELGSDMKHSGYKIVGTDVLAEGIAKTAKKDFLRRTLIRHDPDKLARIISQL